MKYFQVNFICVPRDDSEQKKRCEERRKKLGGKTGQSWVRDALDNWRDALGRQGTLGQPPQCKN